MSKSEMVAMIMEGDERLRDAQIAPLSTNEAQDLVDLWDAFLMYFAGFDLADLPLKALEVMAKIDKILKEQKK